MKQNDTLFLDLRKAEQEYPLSRRKIQLLIKEKRLRAFRLDGKIILNRQDIEQVLTAVPIGAEADKGTAEVTA
jgi:hypothetical protein